MSLMVCDNISFIVIMSSSVIAITFFTSLLQWSGNIESSNIEPIIFFVRVICSCQNKSDGVVDLGGVVIGELGSVRVGEFGGHYTPPPIPIGILGILWESYRNLIEF